MRVNYAMAEPEKLNQENTSAFARLGYDPSTEQRRPSPQEMHQAAQSLLARLKKLPPS